MVRVLIEDPIPTRRLNELSKKEKLGKPPISELHYYWTRKPLITSRVVLLASLSDQLDKEGLQSLSGLNATSTKKPIFYLRPSSGRYINLLEQYRQLIERAKEIYGDDLVMLDPFAGSGMIGFEALRLGLNVVLSDYNPVAYLIMKCTIEYPKKFGKRLYDDVKAEAERIMKELETELGSIYPMHNGKKVLAYISAWQVKCRSCGKLTPLVGHWHLSKDKYLAYEAINGELKFSVKFGKDAPESNVHRGNATCLLCNMPIPNEEVVEDIRANQRERLLAVVLEGKSYDIPQSEESKSLEKAEMILKERRRELVDFIPDEEMPSDRRTMSAGKYLSRWSDLFNPRQLLLLSTMAKKIRETVERREKEGGKDYAEAVGAYLSCWLAKHVDHNSRACHWIYTRTGIGDSVANRGLSMMWTHTEVNPFVKFSGSLQGMLHDVIDALKFSTEELEGTGLADISLHSILQYDSNKKFKLIVTDPPYADDIPYPELSEFFYVWHKRTIGHLLGSTFSSAHVDTVEEIDQGGNRTEEDFYERFRFAVKKLYDLLDQDGLLVVFYAQKRPEIWEKIVNFFAETGFQITNALPLSTENENNVIAQGKNSVYYSLIITARKRDKNAPVTDLQRVKSDIREEIYSNLEKVERLDYKQGELFLWATGLALKHFTSYSKIQSFSTPDTARSALDSAQEAMMAALAEQQIRKYAGKKISVDGDTTFYILTLKNGKRELDTDDFNQSVKSGLSEKALFEKKLVVKKSDGRKVRIYVNDAFSRNNAIEVEGVDGISGNAIIDYLHRAFINYSISPGLEKVDEEAKRAGMSVEDFVGLIRTIAGLEKESGMDEEQEYKTAQMIVEAYDDVRGK